MGTFTAEELAKKRQFRDDLVVCMQEGFAAGLRHEKGNAPLRHRYLPDTPFQAVYQAAAEIGMNTKGMLATDNPAPEPVPVAEPGDLRASMEACLNEVDLLAGRVTKTEDRLTMAEEDPLRTRAPKFFDDLLQLFRQSLAPQVRLAVQTTTLPKGVRRAVSKKAKKV